MAISPVSGQVALLPQTTPQKLVATNATEDDTVKLSSYAKARQLKLQGESNTEIAIELGLDKKTVDSYFGSESNSGAAPAAQPPQTKGPAPQATAQVSEKLPTAIPGNK